MSLGQRVRAARNHRKLTQKQLADRIGISQQVLSALEKDDNAGSTKLADIALVCNVSLSWLVHGDGEMLLANEAPDDGWDDVLGYAQAVGLGEGVEAQEYAETHKLKFRAESLARKRLYASSLAVMYGEGDSMLPRVHPGDAILFDTSDVQPSDGQLYVILVHGAANAEYQVKRAMSLDDVVYFVADNPAGHHQWNKPRRMDAKRSHIEIVGRVRWIGSWEG